MMSHITSKMLVVVVTLLGTVLGSCAFVQPSVLSSPRSDFISTTPMFANKGGGGLFGQDGVLSNIFGVANSNIENPKTIIEIPAKNVKIGALRFVLQIHLVAEQNKPQPKSWMVRQGDESGNLQIYYSDGTGMLSIQFQEYAISIQRHGERPSLQYQLQESLLLHSVLDELSNIAFGVADDDIEIDKRLLILQDDNSIDVARSTLPARQV
jgi:hypothetical protein